MNTFRLFAIISFVLMCSASTFAEPYSVSCGIALEKLSKARKALIPFQRAMERARIHERLALVETLSCGPGGIFSVQRVHRCNRAKVDVSKKIKEALTIEEAYLEGRKVFEERLGWANQVCLLEP